MNCQKIDLIKAAKELVKLDITTLAMHRDGYTICKNYGEVKEGFTDIKTNSKSKAGSFRFKPYDHEEFEFEAFTSEAWFQSAYLRWNELRILNGSSLIPPSYIRIFLGQFNFISEKENRMICCYPVIKLFETGILIVEFRTISPERNINIEEFITKHVNLANNEFDLIEVPPSISKYASYAYYEEEGNKDNVISRIKFHLLKKEHSKATEELTEKSDEGEFSFDLAPLSSNGVETLSSVALTLFNILSYVISCPRTGLKYFIRGQKKITTVGNYWRGRPNIHLVDFINQKETAKENETCNSEEFKSIIARCMLGEDNTFKLPRDCRIFNDVNAYVDTASTLWVCSLNHIYGQNEFKDPNRGHLIYENQVKAELLEYGYMLHRSLFERASLHRNLDEVLLTQESLITLNHSLMEVSHFGEIKDLLEEGWKNMGLTELKENIEAKLKIEGEKASLRENRNNNKLALTVSVLFGILAVPQLSQSVITPIWKILEFWLPQNKELAELFLILVSTLGVFVVILGLLKAAIKDSDYL